MQSESSGDKGARLEFTVAVDLMRQKFHVFLAASANGKTDIVAIKRNTVLRIQVKSRTKG